MGKNRVIKTYRFRNNKLEHYSDDMTFQDVLIHNDDQIFKSLTNDAIINDCDGNEISDDGNSEVGILRLDNNEWICKYSETLDDDTDTTMRYTEGHHLGCYEDLDIPKQWENYSWNNDTMASFKHKNTRIWIDYPKLEDREHVYLDVHRYRFHVQIFDSKDWKYGETRIIGKEYDTDSFEDAINYVTKNIVK